ncbi:dCTP deaminase [Candidatus Gottesmanbacteria bacterium RIFCSPLOWO2_01_FULL_49_10]|uniref:dCTP deaminase n=1 Tax=Candidatus Gottesmanbacteria bacterium RIFCSPLOWO2_01_FULL_49_10 TaxID=1798396 RepID=A0A1F6AYY9_9BACT|nr:MAG: dCTP deaminase [Candidatus Gottesmanbacteria bacterium RIFCSPLOWO2_01_FULL_49_10]
MAVLIKRELIEYMRIGELVFDPPLDTLQLRPHAIDLRLGFKFRVPKNTVDRSSGRSARVLDYYTMKNGQLVNFEEIVLKPGQHFDILPGEMIMGFSLEMIHLKSPMLMAVVYPRSSVNRRGLGLDLTGIVDVGYKGHLMFPIHNNTSFQVIRLYPGERICQLLFEKLNEPVLEGYQGRYKHSKKSPPKHGGYIPESNKKEIQYIREGKIVEIKREFSYSIH